MKELIKIKITSCICGSRKLIFPTLQKKKNNLIFETLTLRLESRTAHFKFRCSFQRDKTFARVSNK